MKTCKKCLHSFDLSQFSKKTSNIDGLYSFCKECEQITRENRKEYYKQWVGKNRAHVNAYSLQYYYNNHEINKRKKCEYANKNYPRRREVLIERSKTYYLTRVTPEQRRLWSKRSRDKNPEKVRQRHREYRATHVEECQSRSRKYYITHREQLRPKRADIENRRRARKNAAEKIENIDREAIYLRDAGMCHICHHKVSHKTFTLDHLIPIMHHGNHIASNLAVAHRRCNSRRGPGRLPAQLRLFG